MEWVLDENGLNYINCICQIIIALAAIIAIFITIKQISSKAKINLKMRISLRLNQNQKDGMIVEVVLNIVNLGMAPVYISSCGVQLQGHKSLKLKMPISDEAFVLRSGHSIKRTGEYFSYLVNEEASLHDKIRLYAICQMDKIYYEKKVYYYDEFKHEFDKLQSRVVKVNKTIK